MLAAPMGLGRKSQPATTPLITAKHARQGINFSVIIFIIVKTPRTDNETKKKFRCKNVDAKAVNKMPQML